ncbi:MAG: hypothetical protein L0H31_03530 [Nocardioidaceae bacterium]|nr:hypothetical protein [Nocardioidaceae bacterium]
MNLPEDPTTHHLPRAAVDLPWHWRLEDASGTEMTLAGDAAEEYGQRRFANQGDAESWVGEVYAELADLGVVAVTLFEVDREVYGPMSLSA